MNREEQITLKIKAEFIKHALDTAIQETEKGQNKNFIYGVLHSAFKDVEEIKELIKTKENEKFI